MKHIKLDKRLIWNLLNYIREQYDIKVNVFYNNNNKKITKGTNVANIIIFKENIIKSFVFDTVQINFFTN
jgi:multisubunit Na+/H+ antiporter MnhB subunit